MARMSRLAIDGQAHLVVQRSNGARAAFVDDADRRAYMTALADVLHEGRDAVSLHAYALLSDSLLLLATPRQAKELSRFMQRVNRRYVAAFHRRHATTGAFWAGRFQAAALDPERYVLSALWMIEQAPVRAGLVAEATQWEWSSARHHAGRGMSSLITEHAAWWRTGNTPFEREARHEIELGRLLRDAQVAEMLGATRGGWPLGSPAFIAAAAQTSARAVVSGPRGRPRRILQARR